MTGFTKLPHEIIEAMPSMKESELRVTLALCRELIGYHQPEKKISITRLQELTGLCRQSVISGSKATHDRKFFRKNGRLWTDNTSLNNRPEVVQNLDQTSLNNRPEVVQNLDQTSLNNRPPTTGLKKPLKKGKENIKETAVYSEPIPSILINRWIEETRVKRPLKHEISKAQRWFDVFKDIHDSFGDRGFDMMMEAWKKKSATKYKTSDPEKIREYLYTTLQENENKKRVAHTPPPQFSGAF